MGVSLVVESTPFPPRRPGVCGSSLDTSSCPARRSTPVSSAVVCLHGPHHRSEPPGPNDTRNYLQTGLPWSLPLPSAPSLFGEEKVLLDDTSFLTVSDPPVSPYRTGPQGVRDPCRRTHFRDSPSDPRSGDTESKEWTPHVILEAHPDVNRRNPGSFPTTPLLPPVYPYRQYPSLPRPRSRSLSVPYGKLPPTLCPGPTR